MSCLVAFHYRSYGTFCIYSKRYNESDGIAQNSSRVISLVQTKSGLSLKITKNRYGENNKKLLYVWDIDCGVFSYVVEEQQGK